MAIMCEVNIAVPLPKLEKRIVRKPNFSTRHDAKQFGAKLVYMSGFDMPKIRTGNVISERNIIHMKGIPTTLNFKIYEHLRRI